MFECLVGYPPFCSENAHDTYRKIIDWKNRGSFLPLPCPYPIAHHLPLAADLYFPDDVHLSRESEDLIRRLLTNPESRLNVAQIKSHPFFYGVDWDSIRAIEAPFVPHLRSITDTSYFPTEDLEGVPDQQPESRSEQSQQKDLAFLGYSELLLFRPHLLGRNGLTLFTLPRSLQEVLSGMTAATARRVAAAGPASPVLYDVTMISLVSRDRWILLGLSVKKGKERPYL